jgi:hypothetical protein
MELTLSPTEQRLLLEILEEHHRGLLLEIARTKHREFRAVLRHKEKLLDSIFGKLDQHELEREEAEAA